MKLHISKYDVIASMEIENIVTVMLNFMKADIIFKAWNYK